VRAILVPRVRSGLDAMYFKGYSSVTSAAYVVSASLERLRGPEGIREETTFRGKLLKENDDVPRPRRRRDVDGTRPDLSVRADAEGRPLRRRVVGR
jgi:hypothetical protein